MSDIKNSNLSEKLSGVGCHVESCKYHGKDNYCHANAISVGSENAIRKAETYCGTFETKTISSM